MISTPYDKIAHQFSEARTRLLSKEAGYLALVLDPVKPGSTVLDLGCGAGHPIATHVAARGHRVVGVDASANMLAFARQRLPDHRWIHARIEDVEFSESFDAVICWDALFHLPREHFQPVIRKVSRWLRPGGRFMVSSGGVVGDRGFTDTMFGHEFFYDSLPPHEMVAVMEAARFDILVAEMCDPPGSGRDRGKWATIGEKRMARYRAALPQLRGDLFLTDGGIETTTTRAFGGGCRS